jgi:hypothetical protein
MRERFGPRAEWVAKYRRDNHAKPTGRQMWDRVLKALRSGTPASTTTKAEPAAPQKSRKGWTADPSNTIWARENRLTVYATKDGYEWWNLITNEHATEPTLQKAQLAAERSKS